MPKAAENKKKSEQNPPKDPLGHQIQLKTIVKGAGLPYISFKNRSTGRSSVDRSEPSLRFTSNNIHMKSGADNL